MTFSYNSPLVFGAEDQNAVRVWDARTGRLMNVALTGHARKVTGVAASPTEPALVATASEDRTIKTWNAERGVCQKTFMFTSSARRVAFLPGVGLIVSGHTDGRLRFWDPRKPRSGAAHEVEVGGEIFAATTAGSGRKLACSASQRALIAALSVGLMRILGSSVCVQGWWRRWGS